MGLWSHGCWFLLQWPHSSLLRCYGYCLVGGTMAGNYSPSTVGQCCSGRCSHGKFCQTCFADAPLTLFPLLPGARRHLSGGQTPSKVRKHCSRCSVMRQPDYFLSLSTTGQVIPIATPTSCQGAAATPVPRLALPDLESTVSGYLVHVLAPLTLWTYQMVIRVCTSQRRSPAPSTE